jgi:hypothetical protein
VLDFAQQQVERIETTLKGLATTCAAARHPPDQRPDPPGRHR